MPELPEVEGFRVVLASALEGRTIESARAYDEWFLKNVSPSSFARHASGRRAGAVIRRGKLLVAFLERRDSEGEGRALALHFGMTGRLHVTVRRERRHRWDRVVLHLDDATSVRLRDPRRLGSARLLKQSEVPDLLWALGPDPLEVPRRYLHDALSGRRAPVKAVLLNQSVLAGLGNIWADESLFAARLDPRRPAGSLSAAEAARLHGAIVRVLRPAVAANRRVPMAPLDLKMPRRAGAHCTHCAAPVTSTRLGGRTSYWCPSCQT